MPSTETRPVEADADTGEDNGYAHYTPQGRDRPGGGAQGHGHGRVRRQMNVYKDPPLVIPIQVALLLAYLRAVPA
jgi:hypothetical protein